MRMPPQYVLGFWFWLFVAVGRELKQRSRSGAAQCRRLVALGGGKLPHELTGSGCTPLR